MATTGLHVLNAWDLEKTNGILIVPSARGKNFFGLMSATQLMILSVISTLSGTTKKSKYRLKRCWTISPDTLPYQVVNNLKSPPRQYAFNKKYKGVVDRGNEFYTRVWIPQAPFKTYVGGKFTDAETAARAYDKYMLENVGDWVYLNFR